MSVVSRVFRSSPESGSIAVAGVSTLLFWVMSLGTVNRRGLAAWDEPVWRFLSSHQSEMVITVARQVTSLGVVRVLLPAAVLAGVAIYVATRSVVTAAAPWVAVQVTAILVSFFKRYFDTPRPPVSSQILIVNNPAFPSGHAANTVALLAAVAVITCRRIVRSEAGRTWVVWSAVAAGVAMGASRLILNVHWLSDVVGGTCLGVAVGVSCAVGGISASANHQP